MSPDLEMALNRIFPTRRFIDVADEAWDRHLPRERLLELLAEFGSDDSLAADLEAGSGSNRSHVIRITRRPSPTWFEFIRLNNAERARLIEKLGGKIHYLSVILSRLWPVWMGVWRVVEGDDPRGARPIAGPLPREFGPAQQRVTRALERFGLCGLSAGDAEERVPWLDTEGAWTLESVEEGKPPTVFECLMASD